MYELEQPEDDYLNVEDDSDFSAANSDFEALSLSSSDWTVETLFGQIEKGNIELSPSFQRREVWDERRKSAFIESLMLNIPVPQVVLAQASKSPTRYIVLDGKQRLLAIRGFFSNEYPLRGLSFMKPLEGKTYNNLDDEARFALDNATIRAVRLAGWRDDSVLYTIFHRLNTGSVSLNTQELRSALFTGPFTSFAEKFTEEDVTLARLFKAGSDRPDFRMRDVELLTRYCGISRYPELFGGNLKEFLDEATERLNELGDIEFYSKLAEDACKTVALYEDLYGRIKGDGGRALPPFSLDQSGKAPRFNRAVFDSLCYSVQNERIRQMVLSKADFASEALRDMLGDKEFIVACSLSTKTRQSLVKRVSMWAVCLSDVLGERVPSLTLDVRGRVVEDAAVR